MRVLQIYNFASHYRGPIYRMLEKALDSDFVVGDIKTDVKEMDLSTLTNSVKKHKVISYKGMLYMVGKPGLLFKDYDTFLLGAEIRDISIWLFLLFKNVLFPRKRVFGWSHGMLGKESKLKQLLYRFFYKMMDGVFVYNERSRGLLIDKGVHPQKVFAVYNSLDYDHQLPLRESLAPSSIYRDYFDNNNKNIVFIGRLTKVKRFDLLLDAVALLKKRGESVNVTFIGDGVERLNMERRVNELGISNQVWFYGACYDEKKNADLIYNADLCVSPGNIGLTAIHALMFGCPAITNNDLDHQMPEFEAIQEGRSGSFFKAGDSDSLAESISEWFKIHCDDREAVRNVCFQEIDTKWNPHNQIKIFEKVILDK